MVNKTKENGLLHEKWRECRHEKKTTKLKHCAGLERGSQCNFKVLLHYNDMEGANTQSLL